MTVHINYLFIDYLFIYNCTYKKNYLFIDYLLMWKEPWGSNW